MVSPLIALYLLLGFFVLLPVLWTYRMIGYYARHMGPVRSLPDPLPRAAVLLSVRGADPSLPQCLAGLLDQDYPGYAVRITVDSEEDPAYDLVCAAVAKCERT